MKYLCRLRQDPPDPDHIRRTEDTITISSWLNNPRLYAFNHEEMARAERFLARHEDAGRLVDMYIENIHTVLVKKRPSLADYEMRYELKNEVVMASAEIRAEALAMLIREFPK